MNFKRYIEASDTWVDSHYIMGTDTDTLTTLPADVYVNDTTATVGLKGQMEQSGTPTPTTPIQPSECGDRTGNLADLYGVNKTSLNLTFTTTDNMKIVVNGTKGSGANVISIKTPNITVPAGTYTVKIKMTSGSITGLTSDGVFFGINGNAYAQRTTPAVTQSGEVGTRTFTLSEDTTISSFDITPSYGSVGAVFDNATFECWFYAGSDNKPYEPYGYKLTISSGGNNLFDLSKYTDYSTGISDIVIDENGITYTAASPLLAIRYSFPLTENDSYVVSLGKESTSRLELRYFKDNAQVGNTIVVTSGNNARITGGIQYDSIRIYISNGSSTGVIVASNIMLNRGSTALPYEPYNRTTTPIYLGEVESTRRIKTLVLTGQEGWVRTSNEKCYYTNSAKGCPADYLKSNIVTVMCSHYKGQRNTSSGSDEVNEGCICFFTGGGFELYIGERTITSAENFKTYLQQQYANGTPVTVWYVLANETTGIVNEPLRKIGDYADTVSGITIPTISGKDSFDVETTLKPSEVSLAYTGWHDATVKEWDGSEWEGE